MEHTLVVVEKAPIVIGATGLASIVQNIRMIVTTFAYSCPLDRGFASSGGFIDSPLPHQTAKRCAELTEAIERLEPRVKVRAINFRPADKLPEYLAQAAMDGRSYPVIKFATVKGVDL